MATLPIHLEVEDIAVGPVLIALRKMPGIIKMDLKLGDTPPPPARQPGEPKGNNAERILAMMFHRDRPVKVREVMDELGIVKGSAFTAFYSLNRDGVIKRVSVGTYVLTEKARRHMMPTEAAAAPEAVKLLPKPRAVAAAKANGNGTVKRTPTGRAAPGEGWKKLQAVLTDGPVKRDEIIKRIAPLGVSEKSLSGVLQRADRDKLAKSDGAGMWQLTDKGRQGAGMEA